MARSAGRSRSDGSPSASRSPGQGHLRHAGRPPPRSPRAIRRDRGAHGRRTQARRRHHADELLADRRRDAGMARSTSRAAARKTSSTPASSRARSPSTSSGPAGASCRRVPGPDRLELVANKAVKDVRAYVLDAENRDRPGGPQDALALESEQPEVVVLAPEPPGPRRRRPHPRARRSSGAHRRGERARNDARVPRRMGAQFVVVVGPEAPRVHLLAVGRGPVRSSPCSPARPRARRGRAGAPGVVVESPSVVVRTPASWWARRPWSVGTPGVVVGAPGGVLVPCAGPHRRWTGRGRGRRSRSPRGHRLGPRSPPADTATIA